MTKKISRDTYLQALGLYTLAAEATKKCRECEHALGRLLGYEIDGYPYLGFISDSISDEERAAFDAALKKEGFEVEDV